MTSNTSFLDERNNELLSVLLVIIDDSIHHVHHGFGGKEHGLHVIQPVVALEEGVGHTMPTAVLQ